MQWITVRVHPSSLCAKCIVYKTWKRVKSVFFILVSALKKSRFFKLTIGHCFTFMYKQKGQINWARGSNYSTVRSFKSPKYNAATRHHLVLSLVFCSIAITVTLIFALSSSAYKPQLHDDISMSPRNCLKAWRSQLPAKWEHQIMDPLEMNPPKVTNVHSKVQMRVYFSIMSLLVLLNGTLLMTNSLCSQLWLLDLLQSKHAVASVHAEHKTMCFCLS